MELLEYRLTAETLCLGEVVKGGIFKPCCKTIRYSSITGALRRHCGDSPDIGDENRLHACGYLIKGDGLNNTEYLIYSPRDRAIELSKLPLQVEYLTNVQARIFVVGNDAGKKLPDRFTLNMGGMISKGFGVCDLVKIATHNNPRPKQGRLMTRIPLKHLGLFGIRECKVPIFGYLFEPHSIDTGEYTRSLFEGSIVVAPEFLVD